MKKTATSKNSTRILKFGGSSLSNNRLIKQVVSIIKKHRTEVERVIVVVSARGKSTDLLIEEAQALSPNALQHTHQRELDMLISTGERISMALLCMALKDNGLEAISFTGSQSGIVTNSEHGNAKIIQIQAPRIEQSLQEKKCVVVAGFQGVSQDKEITTLGRGGSDTSAVALAQHFSCSEVYLYSDVGGYYSADPRICPRAQKISDTLSWPIAYEMSKNGAKVIHPRAVQLAWKNKIALNCLSTAFPQVDKSKISGENLQMIENNNIFNVTLSQALTQLTFCAKAVHNFKSPSKALSELSKNCFDHAFKDSSHLFWLDQRDLRENMSAEAKESLSPCYKISLHGHHLKNDPQSIGKFLSFFPEKDLLHFQLSDTSLSAFIKNSESKALTSLISEIHQEFIENAS